MARAAGGEPFEGSKKSFRFEEANPAERRFPRGARKRVIYETCNLLQGPFEKIRGTHIELRAARREEKFPRDLIPKLRPFWAKLGTERLVPTLLVVSPCTDPPKPVRLGGG